MIIFFILLSLLASCVISDKLNRELVLKYPKYKSNYSKHMMFLAIIINLILQLKFLNKINTIDFLNNDVFMNLAIIICFILIIIISSCLAVSSIIDLLYFELPDELNILIGLSLIPIAIFFYSGKSIFTGIAIFLIYFSFAIFTDSFGMGDAKLALALGFGIKLSLLLKFMFLSFLFASVFSILKIIVYKESLKSEIAFGPYIALSFLLIF